MFSRNVYARLSLYRRKPGIFIVALFIGASRGTHGLLQLWLRIIKERKNNEEKSFLLQTVNTML
jgi:hypothetical protein